MKQEITNFLKEHRGVFLTALFGLVGWLFLRWANARRPKLSPNAKRLLEKLRADTTHDVKGITIHRCDGMLNYWPFRVLDSDEVELGTFYELEGEYLEVVRTCDEMVAKRYLEVEHETPGGVTVYRLDSQ